MSTYALIKKIILKGNMSNEELKQKMDAFLLVGRITPEEYTELMGMLNA